MSASPDSKTFWENVAKIKNVKNNYDLGKSDKKSCKNHDFGFETFFALLLEPSELRVKNRPPPDFGWNRSKTLSFTRGHTLLLSSL